jgi:hypothetical protein
VLIFIKITDSIPTIETLPAQVWRVMKTLKESQEVVTKPTPKWLLVNLVKYDDYQDKEVKNNTIITPSNNVNNLIDIEKINPFVENYFFGC